jgi:hypothetical protein
MGYQVAGDPVPEGTDLSAAPLEAALPDKAQAEGSGTPEPVAEPAAGGQVRLATVAPVATLHVPPLDDGGSVVVITQDGTDVDQATARRAHEAARSAGITLREL